MTKTDEEVIAAYDRAFESAVRDARRIMIERATAPGASQTAIYYADIIEMIVDGMRFNHKLKISSVLGEKFDPGAAANALASAFATTLREFVNLASFKAGTPEEGMKAAADHVLDGVRKGVHGMIDGDTDGVETIIIEKRSKDFADG
jgi:hypothetical protein